MAKINDLKRAIALDATRCVYSKNHRYMVPDSRCFSSLSIKFGQENRKGIGSVKVKVQIYIRSKMYTYTFDGWFDHVELNVDFKCVTIESDFFPAHLYSINNYKFDGLWHEAEVEGDDVVVPVIASVEAEADGKNQKPVQL